MAQAQISLFSHYLGMSTVATVCMPEHLEEGKTYPALWLLPGEGGDGSEWARYTCLETYAEEYGFIALSPCIQLSFASDMYYGNAGKFYSFITQEFPQLMAWTFPLDPERQYAAGFSMGGYGAFKWAVSDPGRLKAVGTFGGIQDILRFATEQHLHDGVLDLDYFRTFDTIDKLAESPNDALWVAKTQIQGGAKLPRMFFSVGESDPVLTYNELALAELQDLGCDITWDTAPGGHDYRYCEQRLQAFLDWAGIGKAGKSEGEKEALA